MKNFKERRAEQNKIIKLLTEENKKSVNNIKKRKK